MVVKLRDRVRHLVRGTGWRADIGPIRFSRR